MEMYVWNAKGDKTTFLFGDRYFTLSEEEIRFVYDYKLRQNRENDAIRQFQFYVFGTEEPTEAGLDAFAKEYGFLFEEAQRLMIDDIVDYYEGHLDCNRDENSMWQDAVKAVLEPRKGGDIFGRNEEGVK